MSTDPEHDALDHLLARSAPPLAPKDTRTSKAISAAIRSARRDVRPPRSRRSPAFLVAFAGVGLIATTGAAISIYSPWLPWNTAPSAQIEWRVTEPSGRDCIYRLSSADLSQEDVAVVEQALRDPHALLDADGGAVRRLFLTEFAVEGMDMEPTIDQAYAEFAALDVDAGRAGIREENLGVTDISPGDELFGHVYFRLVEDSLTRSLAEQGIDLEALHLTPDSACVVEQ